MKIKRALSMVIALAMLVSLIPAFSASAEPVEEITYEFSSNVFSELSSKPNFLEIVGKTSTGEVSYVPLRYTEYNSTALSADNVKFVANSSSKGAIMFAINIPEAGTYIPSVEFTRAARGGYLYTYIFDSATAAAAGISTDALNEKDDALISALSGLTALDGTYIDTETNAGTSTEHTFTNGIEFEEAGTYYLAFAINGGNEAALAACGSKTGMVMFYVDSLTLTKEAGAGDGDGEGDGEDEGEEDDSAPVDYTYVFTSTAKGIGEGNIENATTDTANGTAPWWFVQGYKLSSRTIYEEGFRMNDNASYGYNGTLLKITVDKATTYVPTIAYSKHSQAGSFRVFLLSEARAEEIGLSLDYNANNGTDIKKVLDNVTPLDDTSIDGYLETATTEWADSSTHTFENITLSKGTYYLMFSVNDVSGEQKRAYIKSFNLKEYFIPASFDKVELSIGGEVKDEYSIARTFERQLDFKMYDTKGNLLENIKPSEMTVSYASTDSSVAKISDSGKITALKTGSTKLSVTVTYDGITKTAECNLTVTEKELHDVLINFGDATGEPGDVKIDEYGWQVNKSKSHSSALEGSLSASGFYSKTKRDVLAIDVYVPNEGMYQPIFYSTYSGSNARTADLFVDEIYIGEHDYGAAGLKMSKLRTVYLTEGVHTFYFDALTPGKNVKYYHTLTKLHLAAREELPGVENIETAASEYSLAPGASRNLNTKVLLDDATYFTGRTMYSGNPDPTYAITYSTSNASVATVDKNGIITAVANGDAVITITAHFGEEKTTKDIAVSVSETGESDALDSVEISASSFVMSSSAEGIALSAVGKTSVGSILDLTNAEIAWESLNEDIVSIDESGYARPVSLGSAEIMLSVTLGGITKNTSAFISVREGKTARSFYTDEKVSAARENITKYSWAKSEREAALKKAERYIGQEEKIWNLIPSQGIPRSTSVGYKTDPDMHYCRYCGKYLYDDYGRWGYAANPLTTPWKIQCKACKRLFPSNDFEKFYELGLNEQGEFSRELALEKNAALVENGEEGYLVNVLYPELYDPTKPSYNKDPRTGDPVDGKTWGVDDSMGYDTGRVYESSGLSEVHTYISYYTHVGLWYSNGADSPLVYDALGSLADAYIYTGDIKYGRAGAIILDRVADFYPDYSIIPYLIQSNNKGTSGIFYVSSGGNTAGKIVGSIWENFIADRLALAYDAFFPAYDDPYVVKFLSEKASAYELENDKTTPEKIRQNCEDGILRAIFKGAEEAQIKGNFGFVQATVATTAVVLDTHPETQEMIDWIYAQSKTDGETYNTGGGVNTQLVAYVSRDGQGNESAPGYNKIWITDLSDAASKLAGYDGYDGMNLYEHPKYIRMIKSYPALTVVRRGVPPIGDSSMAANYSKLPNDDAVMINAFAQTGDIEIAQHFYKMSDENFANIHYDIFTKNPENLRDDIMKVIEEYGEYDYDKSTMLTGYGFGALRAGTLYDSTGSGVIRDTQRDFWMYFGGSVSHNNLDKLSLGVEAYGIPFTTDLGYPEATGTNPNKHQWANTTLAHNAVVVNEKNQMQFDFSMQPLHFDTNDTRVKVMDVDASPVYIETDEYRRTVVMIDYDSEVSYGIDFFKVSGGDDHIYSFHACSEEDPITSDNLAFVDQETGTYAGADVPFGNDPWTNESDADAPLMYPRGYTWLYDISKAENPGENEFWFDFKIEDFRGFSRNGEQDYRLRMTALNDFAPEEVTIADAKPPRTSNNMSYMDHLEYMLIRRKGNDLTSLFTTVIEPYNGERYIKSIENVSVTVAETSDVQPGENDFVKAVKVELCDGRCDYIVYAQNNDVTYNVGDAFEFRGFVGVWTVNKDGKNIYSYVNDGDTIGTAEEKLNGFTSEVTGTITDFQDELSFDNWIEVELDREISEQEADMISGRLVNLDNPTKLGNSSFIIEGVEFVSPTNIILDLGEITLIDGYIDPDNEALGYSYDAEIGRKISIPMAYEDYNPPVFDEVSDTLATSAGNTITVTVNATAEEGDVTYVARTLPRGASFDPNTATFTWKPTGSQLGINLVAIDAIDAEGRAATQHFTITVYGSTTGSGSGAGSNSGSGGGGGGGAAPAPSKPAEDDKKEDKEETSVTPSTPSVDENVRFVDLGAHAWARDAINALADEEIIKGTSENTFSPASNITRADFALLLVRAFKLESDNTENFADVAESDYFAKELAIARNTGIAGGIGDNKYAPRNTITRQDMMTIVFRAMQKLDAEFGAYDEPQYDDFDAVAEYAKDAVKTLIGAGLVNGKSGNIAPTDYTTRAEVAVLLKRILDYTTK